MANVCFHSECDKPIPLGRRKFCSDSCCFSWRNINHRQKAISMESWECICPLCGKRHLVEMEWMASFLPRIYCSDCKEELQDMDLDMCEGCTVGIVALADV